MKRATESEELVNLDVHQERHDILFHAVKILSRQIKS